MSRQLQPNTPLARLILDSGKPAYVVAGEVGINYNRLLDYADGRMRMSAKHRIQLARYFGVDPAGAETEDTTGEPFAGAEFDAMVGYLRATPGDDVILTLAVNVQEDASRAWELTRAAGLVLRVGIWNGAARARFTASVDSVDVKPLDGLIVRLRVPFDERHDVLRIALDSFPVRVRISV